MENRGGRGQWMLRRAARDEQRQAFEDEQRRDRWASMMTGADFARERREYMQAQGIAR